MPHPSSAMSPAPREPAVPIYVAIDVSGSLTEDATAATAAVNQLAALVCGGNGLVARHCWFSVVQFATDAHELLRMCRLRAGQVLPDVRHGGVTNFGPLFTLLTALIRGTWHTSTTKAMPCAARRC